jgi:hypothetical protein
VAGASQERGCGKKKRYQKPRNNGIFSLFSPEITMEISLFSIFLSKQKQGCRIVKKKAIRSELGSIFFFVFVCATQEWENSQNQAISIGFS